MDNRRINKIIMKKIQLTLLRVIQGKIGNFLNGVLKKKTPHIEIEGYILVKDLTPSYTSRVNRVGIYTNAKEEKVVIKRSPFAFSNLDSLYTKNEASLLETLTNKNIIKKIFPKFIEYIEKPHLVAFVTEYCEGVSVESLDKNHQEEIARHAYYALKNTSRELEKDNFSGLSIRKPASYLISFPFSLLRLICKDPKHLKHYISLAVLFYSSLLPTLWKKPSLGLVHRDLFPDNMLYNPKNKSITITDWESAVVSDSLYDLAQIAMIYTREETLESTIEFLRKELLTENEKRRFTGLAVFNSIQMLANTKSSHPVFQEIQNFLDILISRIMPRLFYKKSLFELLFGLLLNGIYVFYKITKLSIYSTSKKIILCYHSIGYSGWRYSTDTHDFLKQVNFLQKHYTVLSLPNLLNNPGGAVTITFDDGYRDVVDNAMPILDGLHIPATMFALGDEENSNRDELDNRLPLLTKKDLLSLKEKGWEIGSHTLTHSHLQKVSDEQLTNEISFSKKVLEDALGFPIHYFAYPKGIYSNKIVSLVKSAGYTHGLTTNGYEVVKQEKNPLTINRILLEHTLTQRQFEALLSPLGLFLSRISIPVLQFKEMISTAIKGVLGNTRSSIALVFRRFGLGVLLAVLLGILLTGFIKGDTIGSHLVYQHDYSRIVGGPFEASNSTSRYALTKAIVDDKTFSLNLDLAKFASPDVVYYDGKFTSIFTPGLSFLGVPLYMLGALFGMPQLFSYITILIFAIIDVLLIAKISQKMGGSYAFGLLGGLVFLFATNALVYSLTYTQHIVTVTIIILALLNSLSARTVKNDLLFGALYGIGILIDIPNVFLLLPVACYVFIKHFSKKESMEKVNIAVHMSFSWILVGLLPFLLLFATYNVATTGSLTKLGQTIGRSTALEKFAPEQSASASATFNDEGPKPIGLQLPFSTRAQLAGAYTLLMSDERSWIYYSPIVFIGLLGLIILYKREKTRSITLVYFATIFINILLYSMFGDPWGGWAFGPRYLIPSAGILCLGIGAILERYKKNIFLVGLFFVLLFYSIWVNSLGALTTSSIPPKIESIHLSTPIPWTYAYNQEILQRGVSSSLIYNVFLEKKISASEYLWLVIGALSFLFFSLYLWATFLRKEQK